MALSYRSRTLRKVKLNLQNNSSLDKSWNKRLKSPSESRARYVVKTLTLFHENEVFLQHEHCKKRISRPRGAAAGMSLTKLALAGNNSIIPGKRENR
jgi:hypothetical protein